MSRAVIVAEARDWLGTSYRHQATSKGAGCDCLGLLRGVWRAAYGQEPEVPPPYSVDWDEVARADVLMAAATRHLTLRDPGELEPGDVILFRMRADAVAKHLGICAKAGDTPTFIHSYVGHGVVENSLSMPWRRRIAGVFSFPDLN